MSRDEESRDKRVARSKAAVLAETYRQLSQSGIAGVSIDEVSRNSGVSKTTIYRHWPSRSVLLLDACSRLGGSGPTPNTGSLAGDLAALAGHVAEQLRNASWPTVYPSIVDAAERDPEVAAMQATLHRSMMTPFVTVVDRARVRGEVNPGICSDAVVAFVVGPLFFRRWFAKQPIDHAFVKSVVATAMAGAGGACGSPSANIQA